MRSGIFWTALWVFHRSMSGFIEAQNSGLRDYAKTNSQEYFADFFTCFIRYCGNKRVMEALKKNAPQTYRYMKQLEANGWLLDRL